MNMSIDPAQLPCTLEMQLFGLIDEYGLPEVLDRLAHLIHEQSDIPCNARTEQYWRGIEQCLEQSVDHSLHIKAVDPLCGRWAD